MVDASAQAKNVSVVVAVFAVVGIGIGLTGYLAISGMLSGMEGGGGGGMGFAAAFAMMFGFILMIVTFLLGPVVAAISGLLVGIAFRDRSAGAVVGGAGSFIGFYMMVVVAIAVIVVAIPGGGGGGGGGGSLGVGQQLGTILKAGVPSGLVGAVSGAIGVDFGG